MKNHIKLTALLLALLFLCSCSGVATTTPLPETPTVSDELTNSVSDSDEPTYPSLVVFESQVPIVDGEYQYPDGFYVFSDIPHYAFYHIPEFDEMWEKRQSPYYTFPEDNLFGRKHIYLDSFGEISIRMWNRDFTELYWDLFELKLAEIDQRCFATFNPYKLLELDEIFCFPENFGEVQLEWTDSAIISIRFEFVLIYLMLLVDEPGHNHAYHMIQTLSEEALPEYEETVYRDIPAWKYVYESSNNKSYTKYYQQFTTDGLDNYLCVTVDNSTEEAVTIDWCLLWEGYSIEIQNYCTESSLATTEDINTLLDAIYAGDFFEIE